MDRSVRYRWIRAGHRNGCSGTGPGHHRPAVRPLHPVGELLSYSRIFAGSSASGRRYSGWDKGLDGVCRSTADRTRLMYGQPTVDRRDVAECPERSSAGLHPAHPVILGSIYGAKHKPPYEYTAENNTKALVTRKKLKIEFDEEKKIITVSTPGNNKVELNDDGESVTLTDANGNEVKMDKDGISLSSAKDIKLSAKGNITMDATMKLSGSAKQDASLEGLNVTVQGKMGATVKGNATAELSASGQTTVKGAMVMIN